MRDIRLAIRSLARSPRFTLAALLALSLGIGAATTIFSVADGLLFRPLPYREADRLVAVMAAIRSRGFLNWDVPAADLDAWRAATPAVSDLAGYRSLPRVTLKAQGDPEEVAATGVTPNFFRVLGVSPARGREFTPDDFVPGAPPVCTVNDRCAPGSSRSDRAKPEPGSVPGLKASRMEPGVPSTTGVPDRASVAASTIPCGMRKGVAGLSASASRMNSRKMGAAASAPCSP